MLDFQKRLCEMFSEHLCSVPSTDRWRRDNWEIKLMEQPDEHYSLVGGNLVINNPKKKKHAGTYICVARNIYGTVISKEARVKFGCELPNQARSFHRHPHLLISLFCLRGRKFWRSFLRRRETRCMSKKGRELSYCVRLRKHGQVCETNATWAF